MLFSKRIPKTHRYYRIIEKINTDNNRNVLLRNLFLIITGCLIITQSINYVFYGTFFSSNVIFYILSNISYVILPMIFLLFNLVPFFVIAFVLYISIRKKESLPLLHFWCEQLIKHQLLAIVMDPNLMNQYEERSKNIAFTEKLSNRLIKFFYPNNNKRFDRILYSKSNINTIFRILNTQSQRISGNTLIKLSKFSSLPLIISIIISIIAFKLIPVFDTTNDTLEYIIGAPFVASIIIFGILTFIDRVRSIALRSVNLWVFRAIVITVFLRDPDCYFPMINLKHLNPILSYENIERIVDSYLHPSQTNIHKVNIPFQGSNN